MYIFLDVDGVLNKDSDWKRPFSLNKECVDNFLRLLEHVSDVKIVLSSSWRNGIARDGSRAAHVEDLMKALNKTGICTIDKTAIAPDGSRSKEIEHYLKWHESDKFLILDDDPQLFDKGSKTEGLYVTDCKRGLTERDVKGIVKRLL